MSKFVPLKIVGIVKETPDANTIQFEKPSDGSFNYIPGQYLTLKVEVAGESLRRAYSLCSSPYSESVLAVTVKRVEGGRVSNYIPDNFKVGDVVEVMPPAGKFANEPDPDRAHHYVLIAGGSGITPMMSILKGVLEREPKSKITLLYANRDIQSIIFDAELKGLVEEHPMRLKIVHCLENAPEGWTGLTGRFDNDKLLSLFRDIMNRDHLPNSYWTCGPAPMMEGVQTTLAFMGVPKEDVHRELFTTKLADPDAKKAPVESKRGTYTVKVILDDERKDITVDEQSTILESAISQGMDPPYACQMGVCCTCRAKLLSGKVEMEEDEGLSEAEIEEGFILTCQSHPLTPDCEIEYM